MVFSLFQEPGAACNCRTHYIKRQNEYKHLRFMSTAPGPTFSARESTVRAREDAVNFRENVVLLREHAILARELTLAHTDQGQMSFQKGAKPCPHDMIWVGDCPGEEWSLAPWIGTQTWYRSPKTETYSVTAHFQYGC